MSRFGPHGGPQCPLGRPPTQTINVQRPLHIWEAPPGPHPGHLLGPGRFGPPGSPSDSPWGPSHSTHRCATAVAHPRGPSGAPSWAPVRAVWGPLGPPLGPLATSWGPSEALWVAPRACIILRALLGMPPRHPLGPLGGTLKTPRDVQRPWANPGGLSWTCSVPVLGPRQGFPGPPQFHLAAFHHAPEMCNSPFWPTPLRIPAGPNRAHPCKRRPFWKPTANTKMWTFSCTSWRPCSGLSPLFSRL